MRGKIIADWTKVDCETSEGRRLFIGAMNHFLGVANRPEVVAALQHFTLNGDFPDNVRQIIEKYHITPSYDEGWRNIFDVRDFTGTKESGFKMLDVSSGLSFRLLKPGEKVVIEKMSGSEVTVGFDLYGGALGWQRTWLDDSQYWLMEDTMFEFQSKAMQQRAQAHYDLLAATPSTYDIAWQAPLPAALATSDANYTAVRDYRTINKACETILLNLKEAGMNVDINTTFILTAPIQLKERIARAMTMANSGLSANFPGLQYNVQPQYTMMLAATDKYHVSLPGRKSKSGIRMNLQMFGAFDNLAYTDNLAAYHRFGAIIGETKQHCRCSIA